jgi:monoamine oxidase
MKKTDVLIIGAGAAGLMAAYTLSKAGKSVVVLEARNRVGGRIHTLKNESFFKHAELGAEFVHGNLPVTLKLLKEAGIEYTSAEGEFWHYKEGKFSKEQEQAEGWDLLMHQLALLEKDITIADFLSQNFSGDKYRPLRESVTRFVSGYDTADPSKASTFALRNEWQNEDEDAQYRLMAGYGTLINYLATESKKNGAKLLLNTIVRDINWEKGSVEIATSEREVYSAKKVIIALPLGVLRTDNGTKSAVTFHPGLGSHSPALEQMGFGAIIKLLLEFKDPFWENAETEKLIGVNLNRMGFILSNEEIPTWWTQFPIHSNVLTGWLGGPPANKRKDLTDEAFLKLGLRSLANLFKLDVNKLEKKLLVWKVINWTKDPFTLGSYAYDSVESEHARKILGKAVDDTIYFAGEYMYKGSAMGTVEAALTSGQKVAKQLL